MHAKNAIFGLEKVVLLYYFFPWNWFISFHEFFDRFKFSGLLCSYIPDEWQMATRVNITKCINERCLSALVGMDQKTILRTMRPKNPDVKYPRSVTPCWIFVTVFSLSVDFVHIFGSQKYTIWSPKL